MLETKEQYARHDLDPDANPQATADLPEPGTWVLLVTLLLAFLVMVWRRRNANRKACMAVFAASYPK